MPDPVSGPPADDQAEPAAAAYARTAEADPELTGYYERSAHSLRSTGWALHGAGWATPDEARALRGEVDHARAASLQISAWRAAEIAERDSLRARLAAVRALHHGMHEWIRTGPMNGDPAARDTAAEYTVRIRAVLDGPVGPAEAAEPAPATEHVVETWISDRAPRDYGWQCMTCLADDSGFDSFHTAEQSGIRHAAKAGSVTTTPADPANLREAVVAALVAAYRPNHRPGIDVSDAYCCSEYFTAEDGYGSVGMLTFGEVADTIAAAIADVSSMTDTDAPQIAAAEGAVVRAALQWATGPHPHWDFDNRLLGAVAAYRAALAGSVPTAPALIGTYADPAFVAHQDHKHPVDGCGYCPTDFEETT